MLLKQVTTLKDMLSETKTKLQTSQQKVKTTQQEANEAHKEVEVEHLLVKLFGTNFYFPVCFLLIVILTSNFVLVLKKWRILLTMQLLREKNLKWERKTFVSLFPLSILNHNTRVFAYQWNDQSQHR